MTSTFAFNYCKPEVVKGLQAVHYGSWKFDLSKFNPVKNYPLGHERGGLKPKGGLWTSPSSACDAWLEFFQSLKSTQSKQHSSFVLSFRQESKVIMIDGYADLIRLPFIEKTDYVDWEKLSHMVDAVWLTEKGCIETSLSSKIHLYGWDIETILILNPDCIYNHTF